MTSTRRSESSAAPSRWFDARAFDGVNLHVAHPSQFRRFVDDVLPILRERGVVRDDYESSTLRGNLGLPFVENRYTRARRDGTPLPAIAGAEQELVATA